MFKKCKVVMLPTNKKVQDMLVLHAENNVLEYVKNLTIDLTESIYFKPQHLYIISDDKIKNGDWCIYKDGLTQIVDKKDIRWAKEYECKKIIASTDLSLGKSKKEYTDTHNLNVEETRYFPFPSITEFFIDKYVKEHNAGCNFKEILVEYDDYVLCKGEMLYFTSEQDLSSPEMIDYYKCNICGDVRRVSSFLTLSGKRICNKQTNNGDLKINAQDNTINIKTIKNSWNKEEVINLIRKYSSDIHKYTISTESFNEWIKSNLL